MKPFACTPAEGKPDDGVARADGRAVDEPVALDDADAAGREVELVLAVDVRHLRRLAADQRDARLAADVGSSLDQLGDLLGIDCGGRDVVEQDQRVGAAGDDVVDAVRGHVGAAVAQLPARARDDRLRPDRVDGGGQQPVLVERMEAGKGPEAGRAGGLDGGADPLDDRVAPLDRDSGPFVGRHDADPRLGWWTCSSTPASTRQTS